MTFKKGVSGNPSGKPKAVLIQSRADIRDLARTHTAEAVERLVYWMRSKDGRVSVSAAQALLERGWGRVPQPVTGADGEGAVQVTIRHIVEGAVMSPERVIDETPIDRDAVTWQS